ncbi:MAG TPA: diiron oxygenase [Ilumatobacter sp.]|nr:diiron oxygenase [Ilumatobacter sp.]
MTTIVAELPRTAARAEQLTAASTRMTLDPFEQIDWSIPIDDSAFHLPPEHLSLYRTPVWEAMTEAEQIRYSRHETSALFGGGIWFENALMQIVLRHLTDIDVQDPMHRYLLIEVADECRHSAMFGEYIRRSGTPSYGPDSSWSGVATTVTQAMGYILILAIEEMLDYTNRATMKDERVHPVTRQISKLHVLEEARHVSFAKSYLAEAWPALGTDEQAAVIAEAPELVAAIVALSLDPALFDELGIEDGWNIARSNPLYRANIIAGLTKLTTFLTEVGVITDREPWQQLSLVAMHEVGPT